MKEIFLVFSPSGCCGFTGGTGGGGSIAEDDTLVVGMLPLLRLRLLDPCESLLDCELLSAL